MDFIINHPELIKGEVLYKSAETESDFDEVPYPSKRKGRICYTREGNVIEGFYPIFVLQSELQVEEEPSYCDDLVGICPVFDEDYYDPDSLDFVLDSLGDCIHESLEQDN